MDNLGSEFAHLCSRIAVSFQAFFPTSPKTHRAKPSLRPHPFREPASHLGSLDGLHLV